MIEKVDGAVFPSSGPEVEELMVGSVVGPRGVLEADVHRDITGRSEALTSVDD